MGRIFNVGLSPYCWCGFFFLLGGGLVSTLAYNVMGRTIGFEHIGITNLIPGFSVGAAAGLAISYLVIRNRQVLLNRLKSEQTLTEKLKTEIVERRDVETALRKSEAQLRLVTDNILALVAYVDSDFIVRFCNQPYAAFYGKVPDEILDRPLRDILGPEIYEEDLPGIKQTLAGEPTSHEGVRELGDGKGRYLRETRVPHFGNDGAVLGCFTIVSDLTEYRNREQQLQQAQKMEAVGQMTGGVAHDFNNILTVILGNLEFLSEKENADDDSHLIANSMAAVERASDLTRHLLAFSRKQQLEPQLLDIGEHVERMAQLLKRTLGERIALRTDVEPGLWACVADPAQLESAIMNLCINARDAMPAGGELTIECRNVSADSASDARPADISEGEYVVISITDTGQGMAPETLTRALEPFFTTKDVGHGSGLGLAMIYGFAKQSGGDVALESEEGRGTTVNLYLPRAVKTARLVQKEKKQAVLPGGGETILVIEDDPDVRKLIIHMLQEMTYIVIDVPDVAGARDVLDGRDRVDLVLSDVILPGGTSGPQFADQMKERRPGLKFIFMSGYSPEAAMGAGFLTSGNTLLKKPFQRQQLAAAVREGFDVEIAPSPQSSGTGIAS